MKFLMKCILRSIFSLQIFKFPMLTHVCGVARGRHIYSLVTRRAYILYAKKSNTSVRARNFQLAASRQQDHEFVKNGQFLSLVHEFS